MATRKGVGESNDLVKLVDEYQLEVPKHFRQTWEFDTVEEAEAFMAEWKAKGRVFDGHKIKKPVKDEKGKEIKDEDGNTVYKPVLNSNGKIEVSYCPVGEMVVRCVEQAAKMMKSPVHITGDYLTGDSWAACH